MKLFIAVMSAHSLRPRQEAVEATWFPHLTHNQEGCIFVGGGPLTRTGHLVQLPVPDDFGRLWVKVMAMFRFALDFQWDYLFKCDDDTYVFPHRLSPAIRSAELHKRHNDVPFLGEPEYVGGKRCEDSYYAHGGSGYFLSRGLVQFILAQPEADRGCPDVIPNMEEDGLVGYLARRSARLYVTDTLVGRPVVPLTDTIATCHEMTPELMRYAHAEYFDL